MIGLVVWDSFFRKYPSPPPSIEYKYITDTIEVPVPYEVPKPYPVPTPPRIVEIYLTDSTALDSLKLVINKMDITISGLEEEIHIHQYFLKQNPYNPKLLSLNLIKDTLSLALLQISGRTERASWPIDLNRFNYRWTFDAGFSRQEVRLPPTKERFNANYFVGGGIDIFETSPYLSGSAEITRNKFRAYSRIDLGLLKGKTTSFRLGLDYNIYGRY